MRNAWPRLGVVVVSAAFGLAGCNSTQPERVDVRTASVSVKATATSGLFDCYEVWTDATGDDIPDTFTGFYTCDDAQESFQRQMPWNYSLSISIIRKGGTTEEIATSLTGLIGSSIVPGDTLDDFVSVTDSDPTIETARDKAQDGPLFYVNGKRVSRGSPVYHTANSFTVGTPNILTTSPTFDFNINTGDTIIVRARKQTFSQSPGFLPADPDPTLLLEGTLAIGGAGVVTSGTSSSTSADKSGFAFSYTVP